MSRALSQMLLEMLRSPILRRFLSYSPSGEATSRFEFGDSEPDAAVTSSWGSITVGSSGDVVRLGVEDGPGSGSRACALSEAEKHTAGPDVFSVSAVASESAVVSEFTLELLNSIMDGSDVRVLSLDMGSDSLLCRFERRRLALDTGSRGISSCLEERLLVFGFFGLPVLLRELFAIAGLSAS